MVVHIIFQGTHKELLKSDTQTGKFLRGEEEYPHTSSQEKTNQISLTSKMPQRTISKTSLSTSLSKH
jgi:excinuclease UvrABC ATPase subunit